MVGSVRPLTRQDELFAARSIERTCCLGPGGQVLSIERSELCDGRFASVKTRVGLRQTCQKTCWLSVWDERVWMTLTLSWWQLKMFVDWLL